MKDQYWIGVCPPLITEQYADKYKKLLQKNIGWYGSVNSIAHITFFEFMGTDEELQQMKDYLSGFCKQLNDFEIHLNRFSNLDYACQLLLDKPSEKKLKSVFKKLAAHLPFSVDLPINFHPHMSIGRNLSEEQRFAAKNLFSKEVVEHTFTCTDLAIRKLDKVKKQYEVIERGLFGNPTLSLFI